MDDKPPRVAARRAAVDLAEPDTDIQAPLLPLHLAESTVEEPADPAPDATGSADEHTPLPKVTNLGIASRDGAGNGKKPAHPGIPAWDDILLGVRRKRD